MKFIVRHGSQPIWKTWKTKNTEYILKAVREKILIRDKTMKILVNFL